MKYVFQSYPCYVKYCWRSPQSCRHITHLDLSSHKSTRKSLPGNGWFSQVLCPFQQDTGSTGSYWPLSSHGLHISPEQAWWKWKCRSNKINKEMHLRSDIMKIRRKARTSELTGSSPTCKSKIRFLKAERNFISELKRYKDNYRNFGCWTTKYKTCPGQ